MVPPSWVRRKSNAASYFESCATWSTVAASSASSLTRATTRLGSTAANCESSTPDRRLPCTAALRDSRRRWKSRRALRLECVKAGGGGGSKARRTERWGHRRKCLRGLRFDSRAFALPPVAQTQRWSDEPRRATGSQLNSSTGHSQASARHRFGLQPNRRLCRREQQELLLAKALDLADRNVCEMPARPFVNQDQIPGCLGEYCKEPLRVQRGWRSNCNASSLKIQISGGTQPSTSYGQHPFGDLSDGALSARP